MTDWHCAVKNTTTSKDKWYYHLFYDFDGMILSESEVNWIVAFMNKHKMSFILRKTIHGYHLVGLTPVSAQKWGFCFEEFQTTFPTYHDGQAIRITKKMQDEFITIADDYSFPFVTKLAKRFSEIKYLDNKGYYPQGIDNQWYVLLYYTTNKKNIKNKEVIAIK